LGRTCTEDMGWWGFKYEEIKRRQKIVREKLFF
jgi:hypothetical protein